MIRFSWNIQLLSFYLILCYVHCYIVDPGPVVKATRGGVWPKPKEWITTEKFFAVDPKNFNFSIIGNTCSILENALARYKNIIEKTNTLERRGRLQEINIFKKSNRKNEENYAGTLNTLKVYLSGECKGDEFPYMDMPENYELIVVPKDIFELKSDSIWGILRGLETFSQLIHFDTNNFDVIINETIIADAPRFPFRGLLLDTSRHFMPVYIILQTLEAMSYNKLNVLHWHIVDDHSFPYQSIKYPELSASGAYNQYSKIYTQKDIQNIIEYARLRGIRVMPEFDTPGHTRSWGEGISGILTECFDQNNQFTGKYGPMDPSQDKLYTFLEKFFKEIIDVFPDPYLHLGGDEVEFECWESNKHLNDFMASLNISNDYKALENYYIQKLLKIVTDYSAKSLVWEEVFVNGVVIPNSTIVHVWKDDGFTVLDKVTKAGKPALLSACWYLDHLETGGDWQKYYNCDPFNADLDENQKKLVLGGSACMWSESVNEYNVGSRIWPRASAAAEKLWSPKDADTNGEAAKRLEEHTCRMNHRGIPAQPPNGPGFCS